MKRIVFLPFLFVFLFSVSGQTNDLFIPLDIKRAYENNTRSYDGQPGSEYAQNYIKYDLTADIDPINYTLKGKGKITFYNNFDFDQKFIALKLYHNFLNKGAVRGRSIDERDIGKGIVLNSLKLNDKVTDPENEDNIVFSTQSNVVYKMMTKAKDSSVIEVEWTLDLPEHTHSRFGPVDETSYFIAYWYPQVSVYDDINGWDLLDYTNLSEVYNEYSDFNVDIKLPENFIVWATGELQNPEQVFQKKYMERLEEAKISDQVISIIEEKDIKRKKITQKGSLSYQYSAKKVSDFAFGYSDHYLWDATSIWLKNNKKVFIESVYLPSSENFKQVADIAAWVVKGLSDSIMDYPYPYPKMTVFNGDDGMEYPMIVNDREEDADGTYFITAHEIAHTYFPFLTGTNQRRHGWVDEGLVTMLGVELHNQKIDTYNFRKLYIDWYSQIAGTQQDVPSMVNSAYISDEIFQQHEYMRSSLGFWILRDIIGENTFKKCLKVFTDRWKYKHPTPYDLFFTINDVTGENYNWFYQPWFIDFSYPDIGIEDFTIEQNIYHIRITNYGGMPYPVKIVLQYSDHTFKEINIDARIWKDNHTYIVRVPREKTVSEITLNTDGYPDVNYDNNTYEISK